MPAASRTVRVSTPSVVPPAHASPTIGPRLTRARVGLSPTSPHALDGMRMDPPPSLPCAAGTMPLATAAADPPEEPPAERPGSQGLRAAGKLRASVVTVVPISGTFVRPSATKPAARNASARYDVTGQGRSRMGPRPKAVASPSTSQPRSLKRTGTPRNGPSGTSPAASARAWSNRVLITASSRGFTASMRPMAASTSSAGLASPRRASSACAVASSHVVSVTPARYPADAGQASANPAIPACPGGPWQAGVTGPRRGGACAAGCRYLIVSGPAALNVLTTVLTFGTAVVLVLHLPLPSFGRSPRNPTSTLPLPDAPANWPVLWPPDTV